MAKWDSLRIGEFQERHLDTNNLFEDQVKLTSKHNDLVNLAILVNRWIGNTQTTRSSEYRGFKNHFVGSISTQWTNVIQLAKDLQETERSAVLLEVQSKLEIGLNLLHLIKITLEEIGSLCTFFSNKRKVRRRIHRAHRGHLEIKDVLERALEHLPFCADGSLEFFRLTEVLIGSIDWNYLKIILEQGEHNLRKVIDTFF